MLRTYLFVPGTEGDKIKKALASSADAVVIDLEDAVAPAAKDEAREVIQSCLETALDSSRAKPQRILRCNGTQTEDFPKDLALASSVGFDALMVPKCESAEDMVAMRPWPREVIPLVETALGIHQLEAFLTAHPGIKRAAFGAVDFALDLGLEWTADGEERRFAMSRLALVSRALRLGPPIDAAFPLLREAEVFLKDVRRGRALGFFGKLVIHPSQVAPVHSVYSPSELERTKAARIVEHFEKAGEKGAFVLDGQLIDLPVYLQAKQVLEIPL